MTKNVAKENSERKMFRLFAEAMSWPTDLSFIQSTQPPAPDILYTGLESHIAFELVEICASDIAHKTAKLQKHGGTFVIWTSDPTRDILNSKIEKSYDSVHPIHLLCYQNGHVVFPDSIVKKEIISTLTGSSSNDFTKIWYFGEKEIFEISPAGQLLSTTSRSLLINKS